MINDDTAYQALTSKDTRFDGLFYVGVTSTGIYCRPVCPVKAPRRENCLFFASAEAAEKAAFRPCLRCRPELAPGNAPVDHVHRVTELLLQRIDEGMLDDVNSLEEVAAWFHLSLRQLRRIVQQELGVSPLELKQTRRLLLAKQLLTETRLPITEIAFASGFSSLRRFNDVFNARYRMPPSRLRKEAANGEKALNHLDSSTLLLSYRPPYNWQTMLDFLRLRALKNVEWVDDNRYLRTVQLGRYRGWICVTHVAQKNALQVEFSHALTGALPALLRRLRNLFDLNAHPQCIDEHLRQDPLLSESIERDPGLRVPGAFDGFEMTVRAVLGQQITVKAATTLGGRFVSAFGEAFATPFPELTRLAPTPQRIAEANVDEIACLGIVSARARSILALAAGCAGGDLQLDACTDPEAMMQKLKQLPGIGDWTAAYIAMRALRWPDAFPAGDIVVRNNLGKISAKQAEVRSAAWQPWRSYAVMHIWKNLTAKK
ncbi:AraC family transcriptional regulator of adaptative response / DNA-3-methyladenine glycosylase II [Pantoea alhagi]|uniref:AlkA N-terminal domain-containing protein n=1 Tax=Mixta sp. BE291 TaxID=3158787 RepID=UPI0028654A69|nr:AraC family transcriptional regulator of adaptative response / DNA-3-methyladenine glycosylase II [Pantoea alhagi]